MQPCRPQPAYQTNAPIGELAAPELVVLAAARMWAAPHRQPDMEHPDWRCIFMAAGIEESAEAEFDALFRLLGTAARAPLDVRCPRCARLGEDEAWLLQLVSLLQHDRAFEAGAILEHWLPRAAARIALAYAGAFAAAMTRAQLTVPQRPADRGSTRPFAMDNFERRPALVH